MICPQLNRRCADKFINDILNKNNRIDIYLSQRNICFDLCYEQTFQIVYFKNEKEKPQKTLISDLTINNKIRFVADDHKLK